MRPLRRKQATVTLYYRAAAAYPLRGAPRGASCSDLTCVKSSSDVLS
jgi:hypothetical protein